MSESTPDLLGLSVREFAAATAGRSPTPGGGSVAGVAAALGVALGEMALAFTRGKKKFAADADLHDRLTRRLARARGMVEDLVADDVAAYGMYTEARGLPEGAEADRARDLATAAAIDVPRELTKVALAVLGDLGELAPRCNRHLVTDLLGGALLCKAAVDISHLNVRVNAPQAGDQSAVADIVAASAEDVRAADDLCRTIHRTAEESLA